MFKKNNIDISERTINELFSIIDTNKDEGLDFTEFMRIVLDEKVKQGKLQS